MVSRLARKISLNAGRIALVRGTALFFGLFSLANVLAAAVSGRSEDVWWLDLSAMPSLLAASFKLAAAVLLVWYALVPEMGQGRRRLTAGGLGVLALAGAGNTVSFYLAWRAGSISPGVAMPLSLVLAAVFAVMSLAVMREVAARPHWSAVAACAVAVALVFPLAQVAFFGTTDYRRPAAAAVVLGAKVLDDGRLSSSLADRVRTGVELYHEGLVTRLVMSGGVGANGIDEAAAMRNYALVHDVPSSAIIVDSEGVNTDATVRNTCALLDEGERLLVVSQFYHLPRIKLAFRAAGRDVYTVPAAEQMIIGKTPLFVAREIPGFWVYWARAFARDLSGA